jgi:hypothetical protein
VQLVNNSGVVTNTANALTFEIGVGIAGAAAGTLSCAIPVAASSCVSAGTASIAPGDLLTLRITGTKVSTLNAAFGFVCSLP